MKKQEYIEDAIKCALEFLKRYPDDARRYKAFKALIDLTLTDLNSDNSVEKYEYTAKTIATKMKDNDADNIRKELNKLCDECDVKHIKTFNELATKYNFSAIPKVRKRNADSSEGEKNLGGRKKENNYYIDYTELQISAENIKNQEVFEETNDDNKYSESNKENSNIHDSVSTRQIEYFIENISLHKLFNWMVNYELSGVRFFLDAAKFILALIIAIGSFLLTDFYFTHANSLFDFSKNLVPLIMINFVTFLFVRNTWSCIIKRIIYIFPPLVAPIRFTETQLECVATDKIRESTGKPIRKIQLVCYWATCPICKDKLQRNVRIDVSKGGKEFHNRLIGRCSESPTEHVFSFDRITRIGKPLRD